MLSSKLLSDADEALDVQASAAQQQSRWVYFCHTFPCLCAVCIAGKACMSLSNPP